MLRKYRAVARVSFGTSPDERPTFAQKRYGQSRAPTTPTDGPERGVPWIRRGADRRRGQQGADRESRRRIPCSDDGDGDVVHAAS
jgi:hypothetical protein